MKIFKITSLYILIACISMNAQESVNADPMKDGTFEEQFEHLVRKSHKYNEGTVSYRVVKTTLLNQLESNVDKAMKELETGLSASNETIGTQASEIETLKEELKITNENLAQVNKEKNNMNLLGIAPMKKAAYRSIMWTIIFALVALLLFFIGSFWRSNAVTKQTKARLEKTKEEFDAFRTNSMEEELVLRRKLQTEINKRL